MKRMFCNVLLLLGLVSGVLAQDMSPSPEFEKIKWMLGEWTGTTKMSFPGMPEMESATIMKNEMDGFFMKFSSDMEMGGMKMTENGYMGWDEKLGKFKTWTFTSFAPTPRIETATVSGDSVVYVSEPWEVPGMPSATTSRVTVSKNGANGMKMLLEFKDGENWMKVGEATYTKKATTR
jgi:hypothetical protein